MNAVTERLAAAVDLAERAGEIALRWFRSAPDVRNKAGADDFDPVTAADQAVEEFLRTEVLRRFPDDRFFGEETGESGGEGPLRWVVDPIDGTRAFISGNPLWGVLVGLEEEGRATGGAVRIPYLGETFAGDCARAWMRKDSEETPLKVSETKSLRDAILCSTAPELFTRGPERDAFDRLRGSARLTRYGGDCYSYCLLAMGHVDIVVEAGLQSYDIVALVPVITGAGGVVTDVNGGPAEAGGFIVAAASPELHAEALAALRG